jgi:hypothetical protein
VSFKLHRDPSLIGLEPGETLAGRVRRGYKHVRVYLLLPQAVRVESLLARPFGFLALHVTNPGRLGTGASSCAGCRHDGLPVTGWPGHIASPDVPCPIPAMQDARCLGARARRGTGLAAHRIALKVALGAGAAQHNGPSGYCSKQERGPLGDRHRVDPRLDWRPDVPKWHTAEACGPATGRDRHRGEQEERLKFQQALCRRWFFRVVDVQGLVSRDVGI